VTTIKTFHKIFLIAAFIAIFVFIPNVNAKGITCYADLDQNQIEFYKNIVFSQPEIQDLSKEFLLNETTISAFYGYFEEEENCENITGEPSEINVDIRYLTPTTYSNYRYSYYYTVSIDMDNNGNIITNLSQLKEEFPKKETIEAIEKNARIIELLKLYKQEKPDFSPDLAFPGFSFVKNNSRLFSIFYDIINGTSVIQRYELPNSFTWKEFPEIKKAHKIIDNYIKTHDTITIPISNYSAFNVSDVLGKPVNILFNLSACRINPDGYTQAFFETSYTHEDITEHILSIDSSIDVNDIMVDLICTDYGNPTATAHVASGIYIDPNGYGYLVPGGYFEIREILHIFVINLTEDEMSNLFKPDLAEESNMPQIPQEVLKSDNYFIIIGTISAIFILIIIIGYYLSKTKLKTKRHSRL